MRVLYISLLAFTDWILKFIYIVTYKLHIVKLVNGMIPFPNIPSMHPSTNAVKRIIFSPVMSTETKIGEFVMTDARHIALI